MPGGRLEPVVEYLRRAAAAGDAAGVADAELLGRYASARDEAAFELLVWRHARMVHGVCLRVLHHEQDAQDAFQATFLALARQARSIGRRESVGGWLYKVAYRAALRARARGRATHEQPLSELLLDGGAPDPCDEAAGRELRKVLDEQVSRLPEAYRAVFVLRCLAGKTSAEAARELRCPVGTVESRLARARERLRAALVRRGVAVPAGLLVGHVSNVPSVCGEAAETAALVGPTVRAATLFAAGKAVAGVVPAETAALAKGVLRTMFLMKVRGVAAALLAIGVLAIAGYGVACRTQAAEGPQDPPPVAQQDNQPEGGDAAGREVGVVGKVAGGLVRLDLRADAELRLGDRLEVYRLRPRPEYLGRVEIVEVDAPRAVAKVVGRAGTIRPGDLLARRLLPDAGDPDPRRGEKGPDVKPNPKPEVVARGAFAWGQPHNGLRVGLAEQEKVGAAGGARLAVALENVGEGDLVVNLGAMLDNGRKQYPSALRVTLTDAKGAVRGLRQMIPFVAGRLDPFVVPLPAGCRYTLRYDLADFRDEDGARAGMPTLPGRYRAAVEFSGAGVGEDRRNPDGAKLPLLHYWTGAVKSGELRLELPARAGVGDAAPEVKTPPRGSSLRATLAVNRQIFVHGDTDDLAFTFALINEGDKVIDPKIASSKIMVNGKELAYSAVILAPGLIHGNANAIRPGDRVEFSSNLGAYLRRPGDYRVAWEGDGFRSPVIVFRVLPKQGQ